MLTLSISYDAMWPDGAIPGLSRPAGRGRRGGGGRGARLGGWQWRRGGDVRPFGIMIFFCGAKSRLVPGRRRVQVAARLEMSSLSTWALARIAAGSNPAASAARAASR